MSSYACDDGPNSICHHHTTVSDISGRNHDAGRPRHRLVRAEGTRFRLAHAATLESDPASAVADEWLVVGHGGRTEEDHAPPLHSEEGHWRTQDDREAFHRPPQDHRKA